MDKFLFHAPTIIGVTEISAGATCAFFSAGTTLTTVKTIEARCRTKTDVFGRKKVDESHRRGLLKPTQIREARRAVIEPIAIGILASVTAH